MTQQEILDAAMRQSAVDCSCSAEDFRRETNVVVESRPSADASRYLTNPNICALFTYGSNVVASCRGDLIPEVEAFVNGMPKHHRCFEPQGIYELNRILQKADARVTWMHSFYLPDLQAVFSAEVFCPYETRELHPEDFTDLYLPEWSNALCSSRKELDMLGIGAYDGGKLIGLAGCSADCAEMWQIGIDVLPEYRSKGIGAYLVTLLKNKIIEKGDIPFYGTAAANIHSQNIAVRSGFKHAWVETEAMKIKEEKG